MWETFFMMIVQENDLRQLTKNIFLAMGCTDVDATQATDVLLKADMRGIDSHGVARLSGYLRLWEAGRINTSPQFSFETNTLTTANLNADASLGLVSGPKAMALAIEKAESTGLGFVTVHHSNHFGIAGYYSMLAASKGMIGIAMTNASPLVVPTFGNERMLGTNPIAVAFPANKYPAVVIDLATSAAANGKLEIAERLEKPIPKGWVQLKDGQATTDPKALKTGAMLLPLGSEREMGSHKGYALSAMVDIFSAVLSGANFGPWVPPFVSFLQPHPNPVGQGLGHFFGAMRIDAFRKEADYYHAIDTWIERFKATKPLNEAQPVIIPGEPEYASEIERAITGIPLSTPVVEDLKALIQKFNIQTNLF